MCGIWGFCDPKNRIDRGTRMMLAHLNHTRGTDGYGMVWLDYDKNWHGTKSGKSIVERMRFEGLPEDGLASTLLLGHTRRASPGNKGSAAHVNNAHPFEVGDVVMAHNGFIQNHLDLAKDLKLDPKYAQLAEDYKVDSNILAAILDKHGPTGLTQVQGRAGVWWINQKNNKQFNIWCWEQDLAVFQGEDYFVFSSDVAHLELCGFHEAFKIDDKKGQLLTLDIEKGIELPVMDIPGYTPPVQVFSTGKNKMSFKRQFPNGMEHNPSLLFGFQLMAGHIVGHCPECGEYVTWFGDGGATIAYVGEKRRMKHKTCGHIIRPLSKVDLEDTLKRQLYMLGSNDVQALHQWWDYSDGYVRLLPVKMLSTRVAMGDVLNELPWEAQTEAELEIEYKEEDYKRGGNRLIDSALFGLDKSDKGEFKKNIVLTKEEQDYEKMSEEDYKQLLKDYEQGGFQ